MITRNERPRLGQDTEPGRIFLVNNPRRKPQAGRNYTTPPAAIKRCQHGGANGPPRSNT